MTLLRRSIRAGKLDEVTAESLRQSKMDARHDHLNKLMPDKVDPIKASAPLLPLIEIISWVLVGMMVAILLIPLGLLSICLF